MYKKKYEVIYLGFGCGGYVVGYNISKESKIYNYIINKKGNAKIFGSKKTAEEYIKNKLKKKRSK